MQYVLLALALLVIVATALPLVREPYWWVRMFDFPRAQVVGLGVVVLALFWFFYERTTALGWIVLGLLVVAVLYQLWRIAPYTPLWPKQVLDADEFGGGPHGERTFRLVVSNVLMQNRDAERWLRVVRDAAPDVLVAVETDGWWAEQAEALEGEYPHHVKLPQDNTYGMLVYSRSKLYDVEVRHLVEERVPSVWGAFELLGGQRVRFVFLHPRPPRPELRQDSTLRDAELVRVAREIEKSDDDGPVIVAGDLNDVAWSYSTTLFQRLSGLLDPRIGRGLFNTFSAKNPLVRWPLDHVFHSDDLTLSELRRLDKVGSDHFPILVELTYAPEAESEQDAPEADADDHEQAEEVMEDAAEQKAGESDAEEQERDQKDR